MKKKGLLWLLISYAVMGVCCFWSANQTSGYLAGITFLTTLAFSWLPLYVYLNRQDIKTNKLYWVSQGAALLVTLIVALLIFSFESDTQSSSRLNAWIVSFVTYVLFSKFMRFVLARLFRLVEKSVEEKMLPPQTTEGSRPR